MNPENDESAPHELLRKIDALPPDKRRWLTDELDALLHSLPPEGLTRAAEQLLEAEAESGPAGSEACLQDQGPEEASGG